MRKGAHEAIEKARRNGKDATPLEDDRFEGVTGGVR